MSSSSPSPHRRATPHPGGYAGSEPGVAVGTGGDDSLEPHWYFIIWGSVLVPFGTWVIVLLSSIMYYVWRGRFPEKARTINLHGWLAWVIATVLWFVVLHYAKDSG